MCVCCGIGQADKDTSRVGRRSVWQGKVVGRADWRAVGGMTQPCLLVEISSGGRRLD